MNEILQGYLVELLEMIKGGVDFATGQLPLIAEEIVKWGVIKNIITCVGLVLASCILLFITKELGKRAKNARKQTCAWDDRTPEEYTHVSFVALTVICCIISFFVILFSLTNIFMALCTPRLYLIQELTKMVS